MTEVGKMWWQKLAEDNEAYERNRQESYADGIKDLDRSIEKMDEAPPPVRKAGWQRLQDEVLDLAKSLAEQDGTDANDVTTQLMTCSREFAIAVHAAQRGRSVPGASGCIARARSAAHYARPGQATAAAVAVIKQFS